MIVALLPTLLLAGAVPVDVPPGGAAPDPDIRVEGNGFDGLDALGSLTEVWHPPERPASTPVTSGAGAQTGSTLSDCVPRVRVLAGVEHRGWACSDASGGPEETGELVWVPEGGSVAGAADVRAAEPVVITREDVQSLLVSPGNLEVQPDNPWVLVNAETIVFTDAAEHVLTTRVLDHDVEVRVVPTQFTWDFGDGSPALVGTDPGAPWPDHTVAHSYSAEGDAHITLRIEWDASFRVDETSTWVPVNGRPVTVATSDRFEIVSARPRLTG